MHLECKKAGIGRFKGHTKLLVAQTEGIFDSRCDCHDEWMDLGRGEYSVRGGE